MCLPAQHPAQVGLPRRSRGPQELPQRRPCGEPRLLQVRVQGRVLRPGRRRPQGGVPALRAGQLVQGGGQDTVPSPHIPRRLRANRVQELLINERRERDLLQLRPKEAATVLRGGPDGAGLCAVLALQEGLPQHERVKSGGLLQQQLARRGRSCGDPRTPAKEARRQRRGGARRALVRN